MSSFKLALERRFPPSSIYISNFRTIENFPLVDFSFNFGRLQKGESISGEVEGNSRGTW